MADTSHPGRWWHALGDGRIQCDLCPRDCRLHEGQRGACFVRKMENAQMVLTTYGRSSGFCVDPIEKKPLNQFYPGSSVLSFGTAGCNLACKFCQNWDISKSRDVDRLQDQASPDAIAQAALRLGAMVSPRTKFVGGVADARSGFWLDQRTVLQHEGNRGLRDIGLAGDVRDGHGAGLGARVGHRLTRSGAGVDRQKHLGHPYAVLERSNSYWSD
jgi:hypothetical protein